MGGSIFEMSFKYIMQDTFTWLLMVMMFAFMIVVDRAINYAKRGAEGNYCMENLVDKIQAELLMFGAVAITLFLVQAIFSHPLDEMMHMQFEFVDILCSFGACALLFTGGSLFALFSHITLRYDHIMEETEEFHKLLLNDEEHQPSQAFLDIYTMMCHFATTHNLPESWDYGEYMRNNFAQCITDIIDIKWYSWGTFLGFSVVILPIVHWEPGGKAKKDTIVLFFAIICWLVTVLSIALALYLRSKLVLFRKHINLDKESMIQIAKSWNDANHSMALLDSTDSTGQRLSESIAKDYAKPDTPKSPQSAAATAAIQADMRSSLSTSLRESTNELTAAVKEHQDKWIVNKSQVTWMIQMVLLSTTLLLSFYFMHIYYNIKNYKIGDYWHAVCVVPLGLNFVFVMGVIVIYTFCIAYMQPSNTVIAVMLQQYGQLQRDVNVIRAQIVRQGEQQFKDLTAEFLAGGFDGLRRPKELQVILGKLNIYVTLERATRVMRLFDSNRDGNMTSTEFYTVLGLDPEHPSEDASPGAPSTGGSPNGEELVDPITVDPSGTGVAMRQCC